MMLEFCKWDAQVGDVATLASFPLILTGDQWATLKETAEQLASETMQLESQLLNRPDLYRQLGLPQALRRVLHDAHLKGVSPAACRVMRFDFHPTRDGWRVSEVNSDVPGGFAEASAFTRMVSEHFGHAAPAGDPQRVLIDALCNVVRQNPGPVALLAAAGFIEDQQVVCGLANRLRERNIEAILVGPDHLNWIDGLATLRVQERREQIGAIVRFYQGEWLSGLPRRTGWQYLFTGGRVPIINPGCAILSESKRLPLVWDELGVSCPTWKHCCPRHDIQAMHHGRAMAAGY